MLNHTYRRSQFLRTNNSLDKNHKSKRDSLAELKTTSNFFPKKKLRRPSQLQTISQMIQLPHENKELLANPIFKCHFKKKKNKVENNLRVLKVVGSKQNQRKQISERNDDKRMQSGIVSVGCKNSVFRDENQSKFAENFTKIYERGQNMAKSTRKKSLEIRQKNSVKKQHRKTKTQNINHFRLEKGFLFPRFKRFQLLALYRSLLQYSDNDPVKFMKGFQSALSYQRIILKTQIIKKKLWEKQQLTFDFFMETYKYLQNVVFIQNIIDFFQIIFEPYRNIQMSMKTIIEVFMKRSPQQVSTEIAEMIFRRMNKKRGEGIYLWEIIQLCQNDFDFCTHLTKLSSSQISGSKLNHSLF